MDINLKLFVSPIAACINWPSTVETVKKKDFSQLGWLVAWVLERSTEEYHDRRWIDLPQSITENIFVEKLIIRGDFDDSLIHLLPATCSSKLSTVLTERAECL